MKNIIVPIDFSEESKGGLQIALLFAKQQHTNIQLVYVMKKSSDPNPVSFEEEQIFAERKLESLVTEYMPFLQNDSSLRYIIKKGKIYQEVVSQGESYKDSFIAMSTHGASGFEELFIGSNAFKIISTTELPVITINRGECPKTIKKIVMPIDLSPKSRQKVSYTAELARLFGAEIHVIAAASSSGRKDTNKLIAYVNQVAGYLQTLRLEVVCNKVIGDNRNDLIIEYAQKINAELISVMKDNSTVNIFSSNYTLQMISKSPLLILNITPKILGREGSFSTFGG